MKPRNSFFTIGDIVCVVDDLKWTFNTQTVVQTDSDTSIIVKSRYFPNKGTASDVGGMISANNKKNTVNETRMEMHNVTWKHHKNEWNGSLNLTIKSECNYLLARVGW